MPLKVGRFTVQWDRMNENMRVWDGNTMVLNTVTNKKAASLSTKDHLMLLEYYDSNKKSYVFIKE